MEHLAFNTRIILRYPSSLQGRDSCFLRDEFSVNGFLQEQKKVQTVRNVRRRSFSRADHWNVNFFLIYGFQPSLAAADSRPWRLFSFCPVVVSSSTENDSGTTFSYLMYVRCLSVFVQITHTSCLQGKG